MSYKKIVRTALSHRQKKEKYKYLGRKVRDRGRKGLDELKEFERIRKDIVKDFKKHKIDKKTAQGRLLLLYRLTFKKNNSKIKDLSEKSLRKERKKIKQTMRKL
jgi:hypothetical protein